MRISIFLLLGVFATITIQETQDHSGTTLFTSDIYKALSKSNSGSFMVCPLSVEVLLALIHGGAKGKTAREITTVLHLPENQDEIAKIFAELSSKLKSTSDYQLNSANKIFLKKDFAVKDSFKTRAANVFDAEIENMDFGQVWKAEFDINNWVYTKTNGKIRQLVTEADLNGDVSAILINAMYFKSTWQKEFPLDGHRYRTFYRSERDQVDLRVMEMADEFKRFESVQLNAKFLEMPYKGGDVRMIIVLPNEREGLAALETRIEDVIATPINYLGRVHVVIPRFTTETTIQFKPTLLSLGMVEPFSDSADFTDFGADNESLHISKIIQKTYIQVDERGSEAAAGSAGFMVPISSNYVPPPQIEFIADHPFLYFIKVQGTVVFIGRYSGP